MEIAALVEREGEQAVEGLARRFDVSVETIRRDLARLARDGAVRKVHGGARPVARLHVEGSLQERMAEEPEAKAAIAEKLAGLISDGDTIMIDTGSTTIRAADALSRLRNLTVITNSLEIAERFGRHAAETGCRVFLLGGEFAPGNHQTIGPEALQHLNLYRADHAILTVAALAEGIGAMDADNSEAQIARAMIPRARNIILLATASKIGRHAAFRVCGLEEVDVLVSETPPDSAFAEALEKAGVTVR